MSKELVISANRHETRVALLEDDQLVEVYFQRANEYSLAGSIHKGRVTRVLPGMQSAFVDVGLERDTFLYVSDFLDEHEDIDEVTSDERPVQTSRGGDRDRNPPNHRHCRPQNRRHPLTTSERRDHPELRDNPERPRKVSVNVTHLFSCFTKDTYRRCSGLSRLSGLSRSSIRARIPVMEKAERKKLGAWISLLGGSCFVLGALAAVYIAFFMKPATAGQVLAWIGRTLR